MSNGTDKARRNQPERNSAEMGAAELWDALLAHQGERFQTAKGLSFTYTVRGGEIFVDRKDKSITRSSVEMALSRARELGPQATGPKKLGVFGASYLYPVFLRLGVISPPEEGSGDDVPPGKET